MDKTIRDGKLLSGGLCLAPFLWADPAGRRGPDPPPPRKHPPLGPDPPHSRSSHPARPHSFAGQGAARVVLTAVQMSITSGSLLTFSNVQPIGNGVSLAIGCAWTSAANACLRRSG